ncbi:MAG: TrkH family potassium uptake protein [Geminicoccaceae bacterium]
MIELGPVVRVVGLLLGVLALVMLVPAMVDAVSGNRDWLSFVVSAAITGFFAGMLILVTSRPGAFQLDLRQAFLLTALTWVIVPAFAALPMIGLGHGYTDAFFEAMSGLTTTGSTVLSKLDSLPPGILLWRSLLQWLGGIGIIVMAIVLLPFLRIGGMQLFRTESSEQSEKVVPRAFHMVASITLVYLGLTLACAVAYGVVEMSAFDAINHAMATLSTGGYSTHDASFGYFQRPVTHWIGTIFMTAGALPFLAYVRFVRGDRSALHKDTQVRALFVFFFLVIGSKATWLAVTHEMPFDEALQHTAFNVVSVVTTTGFASTDYTLWGPGAEAIFFVLMFLGGCAGSTSGAIKVYRHLIIWQLIRLKLRRLVAPHQVVTLRYAGRRVPEDVPGAVLAFVAALLGMVAIFTVLLGLMGLDLVTALTASATAITNVGPGLGPIVGPAGNFASLPEAAKWLLALAMMLGRLEIFTVFLLFTPDFWRR